MFYLTGPNVLHYQEADLKEPMEELCLHVDIINLAEQETDQAKGLPLVDPWEASEAKDCMEQLGSLPLKPTMDTHRAMPYFLEAYQASQHKFAGLYTTIKHCIIQILLRAVRAYASEPMEAELPSRDMKAYRYQLALEYIHANSSGEVVLEDVAEKLHISSRQLQRIFKEQAGAIPSAKCWRMCALKPYAADLWRRTGRLTRLRCMKAFQVEAICIRSSASGMDSHRPPTEK